jgi:hypothetical protein
VLDLGPNASGLVDDLFDVLVDWNGNVIDSHDRDRALVALRSVGVAAAPDLLRILRRSQDAPWVRPRSAPRGITQARRSEEMHGLYVAPPAALAWQLQAATALNLIGFTPPGVTELLSRIDSLPSGNMVRAYTPTERAAADDCEVDYVFNPDTKQRYKHWGLSSTMTRKFLESGGHPENADRLDAENRYEIRELNANYILQRLSWELRANCGSRFVMLTNGWWTDYLP